LSFFFWGDFTEHILLDSTDNVNYSAFLCDFGKISIFIYFFVFILDPFSFFFIIPSDSTLTLKLNLKLGYARVIGSKHKTSISSPKYASPEVFALKRGIREDKTVLEDDRAMDTYSFGIILWEMMERKFAWEGIEDKQIEPKVATGERPLWSDFIKNSDAGVTKALVGLITECWTTDPLARPGYGFHFFSLFFITPVYSLNH